MKNGLLLGNGINLHLGIKDLSARSIAGRFKNNVLTYSIIFDKVFGVKIRDDFWGRVENLHDELGIETLAGLLYDYIKREKSQKDIWIPNDDIRIQDMLTCLCISSIFFKEDGMINYEFNRDNLPFFNKYDSIYTLNYIEFWDEMSKCIYLHGKFDVRKLNNIKGSILVSESEMKLDEYAKAVDQISNKNNVILFNPKDIIFAPNMIKKNNLVCVTGLRLWENLRLEDDLFMIEPKNLYVDLEKVDELDVFGMSPSGDDSIIDKINSKRKVRVFVDNKNSNVQADEWNKKLTCEHEIFDSKEFMW